MENNKRKIDTTESIPTIPEFEEERQRLINTNIQQNIELREKYTNKIFVLIVIWLIGIFIILISNSILSILLKIDPPVSDAVIIALIGGTTVNVLGLFVIVVQYLFKAERNSK